jgi:hypothetical protein
LVAGIEVESVEVLRLGRVHCDISEIKNFVVSGVAGGLFTGGFVALDLS